MDPIQFFKCLAQDTRLKSLLLIEQHQELCVCDLIDALALSQPKVSRHLAELRKCELLVDERRGKWVYYKLHPSLPHWAKQILATTRLQNPSFLHEELCRLQTNGIADATRCCP
ncbi:metalloregulator ArsR/SmtB family transcription factor [Aliiglaciecola sp. CAU 1673]|uniref:metalloregulator ArsR/SmtB family transcription factor n=1 Tax=Aliiglaciecola sp. CAU 1673 TaxID=3032595 RepID=UPI0023DAB1E0|nr:metalloregulator ArsR/SmtB family transcription factor [Aliiglaciecola sp. CAU 1673]MDF2178363.1 metalloregulator ArsR/SmtB family transcription factor [Aliiglaciecola sp. CAU 1673]